jgi:hypothetical protein
VNLGLIAETQVAESEIAVLRLVEDEE